MLLVGAGRARLEHNSAAQNAQLRWIAGVTASYAADFQEQLWGLNWTLEAGQSAFPDLRDPDDHLQAAAFQATDIMRRRGAGPDLPPPVNWIPVVWYSHLPLADYLDVELPMLDFVAPGDTHRLNWARDPEGFAAGAYLPFQPNPLQRKSVYSMSYQPSLGMVSDPVGGSDAIQQAASHSTFTVPAGARMQPATLADVEFPAGKVWLFDSEDRSGAQALNWAEPRAEPQILTVDGAAQARQTSDANPGWDPSWPSHQRLYTRFGYYPAAWEAPADPSREGSFLLGYYRYTRGGPAGRDFGGPEIDTSGW